MIKILTICILAIVVSTFTSFAAEFKKEKGPDGQIHYSWTFGGKKTKGAVKRFSYDDDEKPPKEIPALLFKPDSRWREWSSNRLEIIDLEQLAREKGDFLAAEAHQFKISYADFFKEHDKKFGPSSEASKALEALAEKKKPLLKRRENQAKFENKAAVKQIDLELESLERDEESLREQMGGDPKDLWSDLMRRKAMNQLGGIMFHIAFIKYYEGEPLKENTDLVQRLRGYRELLADRASGSKVPDAVRDKALALNKKLKTIEDGLLTARYVEAQKLALSVVTDILNE